jgi:hypothetical protein
MSKLLCGAVGLFSVLVLAGCTSMTPESVGATRATYWPYSCEALPRQIEAFEKSYAADPGNEVWGWHINAMKEVQAEKQCNMTTAGASLSPITSKAESTVPAAEGSAIGAICGQQLTEVLAKALRLPSVKGALVTSTVAGSPAANAGMKEMDVILMVGEVSINSGQHLVNYVRQLPVGFETKVQVWRDGKKLELPIQTVSIATMQSLIGKNPATITTTPTEIPSSSPAAAVPARLVYGYCFHTDVESGTHWVSSAFEIMQSPTRNMGKEFDAFLSSTNRVHGASSVCDVSQDTLVQASSEQKKNKKLFWLSAKVVEVPWSPSH